MGLRTPREFDFEDQWDLITELTQDWGRRLLEGRNKTLCSPGARRKEQRPHKRPCQTCLWVSRSLSQRHGSTVACCTVGALNTIVHAQILLKEVTIIYITPTRIWPQVKYREGTQLLNSPATENWIKDLLNMALSIRTRPSFPSVSLSHQEASISLLSLSIRGQKEWKTTITEN